MSPSAGSSPRYIPRLVAVSLPSQCGFYPGIGEAVDYNALLSERHAASTEHWDGRVVVSADPDDINNLQRRQQRRTAGGAGAVTAPSSSLSSSPSCWTDLLRLPSLHAKNVLTVPPLQNEDDSFELFSEGQELVRRAQLLDAILDRVRWFAEEADALQGIQLCTDATNVSQSALAMAQAAAHTAAADGALCVAAFCCRPGAVWRMASCQSCATSTREQRSAQRSTTADAAAASPAADAGLLLPAVQLLCLAVHSPLLSQPAAGISDSGDIIPLWELNSLLCMQHLSEESALYLPLYLPASLSSLPPVARLAHIAMAWQQLSLPYCNTQQPVDLRRMTSSQSTQCDRCPAVCLLLLTCAAAAALCQC